MSYEGLDPDQLAITRFELEEKLDQPYLSETRKAQIRREIAHVAFELGYLNTHPFEEAS